MKTPNTPPADRDATPSRQPAARPGKYLIFQLGGGSYGLPVLQVREIIRLLPITPVANMPPHVRGVINLRGRVVPLVDLRPRFGLPATPDNDRTCIVVAQVAAAAGPRAYGVIVEAVEEVVAFSAADLEPTPDFGGAVDVRFVTGLAKSGDGITTLIDLDMVAGSDFALPAAGIDDAAATPPAG